MGLQLARTEVVMRWFSGGRRRVLTKKKKKKKAIFAHSGDKSGSEVKCTLSCLQNQVVCIRMRELVRQWSKCTC